MAINETNVVHEIMRAASKNGHRLLKNVRSVLYALDVVEKLIGAFRSGGLPAALALVKSGRLRKIKAGIQAPGASDLIGYSAITITPSMVNKTLPILTCIEVKTATGVVSDDQKKFIAIVRKAGGIAGVARSAPEYESIVQAWLSEMG